MLFPSLILKCKDILSPSNTCRKTEPQRSWDETSLEIYNEREEGRPLQRWWKDFQLKHEEGHTSQLLFCGSFLHPSDQDGLSWAGLGSVHTKPSLHSFSPAKTTLQRETSNDNSLSENLIKCSICTYITTVLRWTWTVLAALLEVFLTLCTSLTELCSKT